MKKSSVTEFQIKRVSLNNGTEYAVDKLANESPLEIVLAFGKQGARQQKSISVTMRTSSEFDFELVLGFLFSEGIIRAAKDVSSVRYSANADFDESFQRNTVQVNLFAEVIPDIDRLERHFYTSSSCGVCGKASVDLVRLQSSFLLDAGLPQVSADVLYHLPSQLRAAQNLFDDTGSLHASALFDADGNLLCLREDVGRHNALDKLIGWAFRAGLIPLKDKVLMLSGRISFELVQKASVAGIPVVAAIGAPSSLAVELAIESDITLVGFLRADRMNIYSAMDRVKI